MHIRLTATLDIVILWHYCYVVLGRLGQLLLSVAIGMLLIRSPAAAADQDFTVRYCGSRHS